MKTRWLAGVAIFALGFGCAQVMKTTTADASGGTVVDEGLNVIDHEDRFELVNTGEARYLVIVAQKDGLPVADPQIEAMEGSLTVPKDGLVEARIARIQYLGVLTNARPPYRECNPSIEDCVEPWEPLPSPRPPKPFILESQRSR